GGAASTGGTASSGGATVQDGGHHDASANRDAAESDAHDARALRDARGTRDAIEDAVARDVDQDASAASDAHAYCATPGATMFQSWNPPYICGASAYCNPAPDPCNRSRCDALGGACLTPVDLPNGTPCDDGRPSTFAHPAKDGCPSNKCIGGANAGAGCTSD